ncbi:MAG: molybdopterin cofactor-binding domain-containing protein, partial [Xanthomonadales bacterium]|nr:molybdopterin cofactor-binding domain-containing protein [Xanthomonadales bacterium]
MAIKRRDFLKGGTLAAGAFTLGFLLPGKIRADAGVGGKEPFAPNAFIRIDSENRITLMLAKSEMGQNVYTSLPLIIAEELDADWPAVRVEQSGVDPAYNSPWLPMMLTGGSSSVRTSYDALRLAGATARAMLLGAAAEQWGAPVERLTTRDAMIRDPDTGRSAPYGDFAAAASERAVPSDVELKSPDRFRLIGKDHKRLDSELKVTGAAGFGLDVHTVSEGVIEINGEVRESSQRERVVAMAHNVEGIYTV